MCLINLLILYSFQTNTMAGIKRRVITIPETACLNEEQKKIRDVLDYVMHNEEPVDHITMDRFQMLLYVALIYQNSIKGSLLRLKIGTQQKVKSLLKLHVLDCPYIKDHVYVCKNLPKNVNKFVTRNDYASYLGYMTPNTKYAIIKCKKTVKIWISFQYKTWISSATNILSQIVINKTIKEIETFFNKIIKSIYNIPWPVGIVIFDVYLEVK